MSLSYMWGRDTDLYDGLFIVDNFSLFFKAFFLVLGALVVLTSVDYVKKHLSHPGEYYGILTALHPGHDDDGRLRRAADGLHLP